MAGKGKEEQAETDRRPPLDQLATVLHSSFIARWGRHDRAGFERALEERPAEAATSRTSIA